MELFYGPRGTLQIDDARILFPNFEGRESVYNRKGDRNFAVAIESFELAEELWRKGWNIRVESGDRNFVDELNDRGWKAKYKPNLDPDEGPRMRLDVKVQYKQRDDGSINGPTAYLWTGKRRNELDEESIGCLDRIERDVVNLDIRPYDWEVNGMTGRKAYLTNIEVYQRVNRFDAKYEAMQEEERYSY